MAERLRRPACCPACYPARGPAPALADVGSALLVDGLHRCAECRGVLASHRAVEQARRHVMGAHPALQVRQSPHRCRRCQHRAAISATQCARCAAPLALSCPQCRASMLTLEVLGIVVDVCRPCELTYFDAGEFAHACSDPRAFAQAVRPPLDRVQPRASAGFGADVVDLALVTPEAVELVARGAQAAGHIGVEAAGHVVRAAASVDIVVIAETTGKAAVGAAEVATEAAGDVGETILEVIASLFDGL